MKILVTGCAGFIGMHVAELLLGRGDEVIGVDNFNDYYDPGLKDARVERLTRSRHFSLVRGDIADRELVQGLFAGQRVNRVIHLAAQAGVRYSLQNPDAYIQSNLVGFANILEACRRHSVEHLVYSSSSSVYGSNTRMPFSVHHNADHQVSLYGATKKANELMAHSYSHLYGLPTTGLRYFTVYGPWGRPDMAPWLFTSAILEGRAIDVFNNGRMRRDFTFISDIAHGTVAVLDRAARPDPRFSREFPDAGSSDSPFAIYNIGNHQPIELMDFISTLEQALGRESRKNFLPLQPGDVVATFADVEDLKRDVGFEPKTTLREGIGRWVEWYLSYTRA